MRRSGLTAAKHIRMNAAARWSACWGGKIEHYSRNPGIFTNPLGAVATGLPATAARLATPKRCGSCVEFMATP